MKTGNGLDLGGGLMFADVCYREMVEDTLTMWVKNEGGARESLGDGHLMDREAVGFVLKLRAWPFYFFVGFVYL